MRQDPASTSSRARDDGGLTTLERDVLATYATGRITHEVAESLGLSPETVKEQVRSAMKRLGARSKLEAVIIAFRLGHIELPSH